MPRKSSPVSSRVAFSCIACPRSTSAEFASFAGLGWFRIAWMRSRTVPVLGNARSETTSHDQRYMCNTSSHSADLHSPQWNLMMSSDKAICSRGSSSSPIAMPPFMRTWLRRGDAYPYVAASKGICSERVRRRYNTRITRAKSQTIKTQGEGIYWLNAPLRGSRV